MSGVTLLRLFTCVGKVLTDVSMHRLFLSLLPPFQYCVSLPRKKFYCKKNLSCQVVKFKECSLRAIGFRAALLVRTWGREWKRIYERYYFRKWRAKCRRISQIIGYRRYTIVFVCAAKFLANFFIRSGRTSTHETDRELFSMRTKRGEKEWKKFQQKRRSLWGKLSFQMVTPSI